MTRFRLCGSTGDARESKGLRFVHADKRNARRLANQKSTLERNRKLKQNLIGLTQRNESKHEGPTERRLETPRLQSDL
jgi:hypothetical protein